MLSVVGKALHKIAAAGILNNCTRGKVRNFVGMINRPSLTTAFAKLSIQNSNNLIVRNMNRNARQPRKVSPNCVIMFVIFDLWVSMIRQIMVNDHAATVEEEQSLKL